MKIKSILIIITAVIIDLFIYLILGLYLMQYDDFYEASEGEYWSLESMTWDEKIAYIALIIWYIINIILFGLIIYKAFRYFKKLYIR